MVEADEEMRRKIESLARWLRVVGSYHIGTDLLKRLEDWLAGQDEQRQAIAAAAELLETLANDRRG